MKKIHLIIGIIAIIILAVIGYFAFLQPGTTQINADAQIVDANALTEKEY